jgi:parallel beta-helix repeat protein
MTSRRSLLLGALATAACNSASSSSSSGPSNGGALFVAQSGDDANPATELRPVRTVSRALSLATSGVTLFLKGGVYRETIGPGIPSGSSWSSAVRVAAFAGQPVVIRPVGGVRVLDLQGPSYVIFDNLILDGAQVSLDAVKITAGAGGRSHHIRIQNSEVMNAPSQGVLITEGADSNEFINVRIHDNGRTDFGHGMYISTDGNVVDNCDIYRNAGWGVHAYPHPNQLTVRSSRIHNNARTGARGPGIGFYGGGGLRALGNDISGNAIGIAVDYGANGAELSGNRISGNRGEGIFIGGAAGTVVEGNIVSSNGGGNFVDRGVGTRTGSNQFG